LIHGPGSSHENELLNARVVDEQIRTDLDPREHQALRPVLNHSNNDKSTSHGPWQQKLSGRSPRSPVDQSNRHSSFETDDTSFPSDEKEGSPISGNGASRSERPQGNYSENRTVVLKGLSERTAHRDIVAVVRGGALLDIFLRSRDRMASISFASGKAAQEFLTYARRNDIYILDKLVGLSMLLS
jgi:hypothetical protein